MKHILSLTILLVFFSGVFAQSNMYVTDSLANEILLGNYNPNNYLPTNLLDSEQDIVCGIQNDISADSLKSYLMKLESFGTRHVYSDTVSNTTGIGAARRWVYSMFQQFSAENENRLVSSYLQFDTVAVCGFGEFRNIFTVLPGSDTADKSIILFEGHMDSRCQAACDITCDAPGIEDNGSGTALVIELARAMSKYSFRHTLVFMVTIGEELGLYGARAFSKYVKFNGIPIKAVQNNDVIGGVICGFTSSPPSCPFEGHIDSTNVRIFSLPQSTSQGYARLVQLTYQEKLLDHVNVPMTVRVMNQVDRSGRGGDHEPFSEKGYTAVRFTAQNEHGDGSGTPPDRTHTADDVVGVDTDSDGIIDSFFVDFNYLKRNGVINAVVAKIADIGPETPGFSVTNDGNGITVLITSQTQYSKYRVHARNVSTTTSIDSLIIYSFSDTLSYTIPGIQSGNLYYVSVASVDSNGVTSPFSAESSGQVAAVTTAPAPIDPLPHSTYCSNCSSFNVGFTQNVDTVDLAVSSGIVQFTDNSANATQWFWYFGDGSPVDTTQMTSHDYTSTGIYTVTLTASDDSCINTAVSTVVVIDTPVEIEKLSSNSSGIAFLSFLMKPNPAKTEVHLTVRKHQAYGIDNPAFRITDITGKVVYKKQLLFGAGETAEYSISTADLSAGIYICSVLSDRKIIESQKLVIQK